MGDVIRIDRWRRRAESKAPGEAGPGAGPDPQAVERLEAAVARLDGLTGGLLGRGERLDNQTETALLAIVGEISMGRVDEAADRTERLVRRLAAPR